MKGRIDPAAVIRNDGARLVLPPTTILEAGTVIDLRSGTELCFGARNTVYVNCSFRLGQGWIHTGDDVSFGPGVQIYETRAGLSIGHHCLIAAGVLISGVQHSFSRRDLPIRQQPVSAAPVVLEDDVWLGMGAVVLPGVRIGAGTVVGAGSVVTRDLPAAVVAYGQPARVQRRR